MTLIQETLRGGRPRELRMAAGAVAYLLDAREAGTAAVAMPPLHSLWINLGTRLRVGHAEGSLMLGRRECLFVLPEQPVHAVAETAGSWLVLAFGQEPTTRSADGIDGLVGNLFPARLPLQRPLLGSLRGLLRCRREPTPAWYAQHLLADMLRAIADWQSPLQALLPRCPGKTQALRRQCLLRLLKVRNRVAFEGQLRLSVSEMAQLAHYSPCYFVRVFEDVFGESPQTFCARQRMQRAAQLLRDSSLSITEIADRVGYSSGAAFARAFRACHGTSASVARRQWGGEHGAAAA